MWGVGLVLGGFLCWVGVVVFRWCGFWLSWSLGRNGLLVSYELWRCTGLLWCLVVGR